MNDCILNVLLSKINKVCNVVLINTLMNDALFNVLKITMFFFLCLQKKSMLTSE